MNNSFLILFRMQLNLERAGELKAESSAFELPIKAEASSSVGLVAPSVSPDASSTSAILSKCDRSDCKFLRHANISNNSGVYLGLT